MYIQFIMICGLPSYVPAIPVKSPTRKSAPGRVHGKNPQKCAHEPVFCTSEVTRAGSVPNNPPMGQVLGETMVSITCVTNTLSGTWRSNEGATYYFTKYCCVKWKCRIYDNIVSIICLNDDVIQTWSRRAPDPTPSDIWHRNAPLSYVATHTRVLDVISFICSYLY